LPWETRKL